MYLDVSARLNISDFRPEDHTDWERAPPSYDLQSSVLIWMNILEF